MPGLRAPSDARTQGASIAEAMGATEDAAARRVIAGRAPPNVAGRVTYRSLAPTARPGPGPARGQKALDPDRKGAPRRTCARAGGGAGPPGQPRRSARRRRGG